MGRLFGTDGIRGLANGLLTPELALGIASAAARVLRAADSSHRPVAVVGRDGRASGEMLEAAVVAGLTSAGADVIRVGVLPTPAIAFLTSKLKADVGVMLSASHNPMPDNGIKIFARGGHKLPDEIENAIEALYDSGALDGFERPVGADIGRVSDYAEGEDDYIQHLLASTSHQLDGLKIVVDCAHGAASYVAPQAYRRAGAQVTVIAAEPDGLNINDGVGSTHLELLQKTVVEVGADMGFAHDGDADRCLAVSADGQIVDGDQILAICAIALKDQGLLRKNTVVSTVMSNLGFHHAMRAAKIDVVTTAVGDRYVLAKLRADNLSVGGEQSGHVIFTDYATTGDGVLTALQVMAYAAKTSRSLAELAAVVDRLPQVLKNVTVIDKEHIATDAAVFDAVRAAEIELGDHGRVLLRPSGTEQLVRVMVEAQTQRHAEELAERIAAVVAAVR